MNTRKVPAEQVDRIQELTGQYRRFRKQRRALVRAQKQLLETIAQLESSVNQQTRKPLSYLSLTPKMAGKSTPNVRKTRRTKKKAII